MDSLLYFINEDINMDSSDYQKWNTYEHKLIRQFLDANTHRHTIGALLDAGLIKESQYSRRKMVYCSFTHQELISWKMATERNRRISEIFED